MTLGGASLGAIGGAFLALGGALVALYLLRLERRRLEVPFAALWQRVLGQSESVTLHRRLKRPLSLLVMLTVLAALLLAIGELTLGAARDRKSWVFLLDASASMQARDVAGGPTRFERAKKSVRRLWAQLGGDDEVLLVRMDARPRALGPFSTVDELDALTTELDRAEPGQGGADLRRALALAEDALRGRPAPTIVLVSDGALGCTSPDTQGLPRAADCDVAVDPGITLFHLPTENGRGDNLALTAFSARRYRANRSAYEVLVEVQSYLDTRQTAQLTLEDDGETIESTPLDLAPHERKQLRYAQLTGSGSHLIARISTEKARDVLALDDVAYAALPPRQKLRVLLVSAGDLFVEGALLLDENVTVERIAPDAYGAADLRAFDAVVFDGFTPPVPPAKDALYIHPSERGPFAIAGTLPNPVITERDEHHPLGRWLSWRDLNIRSATRFALAPGDVAVASVLGQPVIVARERDGHKSVAVGFDLLASDLPLRMAFPVLVINTLEWFLGGDSSLLASFSTADAIDLPASGDRVTATGPGGAQTLPVRNGRVQLWAERAGFYDVGGHTIAVSVTNRAESDVAPRAIASRGKPLPAPTLLGPSHRSRALWPYLVGLALALLFAEWWSYHRRWTV